MKNKDKIFGQARLQAVKLDDIGSFLDIISQIDESVLGKLSNLSRVSRVQKNNTTTQC